MYTVRLNPDTFPRRFFGINVGCAGLLLVLLVASCTKQELPDLGPRLPQTAALEFSPSLLAAKAEYTDNCGHMQIVEVGSTLQDRIFEAVNRTFASVVRPGSSVKPDIVIRVNLVQSSFTLRMDGHRHLRLRLACTLQNRSAQQMVTEALDKLLEDLPGLDELARRVKRH